MREDLHGDVGLWRFRAPALPVGNICLGIRKATLDDMTFMVALAAEKYPARTIELGIPWMEWCLQSPERLVLVGPNSAGVAQVSWNYGYERRARLDMLGCRATPGAALEALRMVRMMLDWARQQGAKGSFRLDADTGIDFGPFARRLGGKPVTHTRYEIPL